MPSYFFDSDFQDKLVAHLVRDRHFLKEVFSFLAPDDFKPGKDNDGYERWVTAGIALEYYEKYRQPVESLLKAEILDFARKNNVADRSSKRMLEYAKYIQKLGLEAGQAVTDKVLAFKKEKKKAEAVEKILELQETGSLTDDEWMAICREAVDTFGTRKADITDLFDDAEIERRVARRAAARIHKPLLFIDPLDNLINAITRKEIGLFLAPYKRGKSLALIWTALAYTLQGLTVLYVTLEDPKDTVENRFDACITLLPIRKLNEYPNVFQDRIKRFRRFLRTKLYVVDATEGQCSIAWLEELLVDEREKGRIYDAIIVDYDDEIKAPRSYKGDTSARRFEFADVYRGLRQLASKWDAIVWTAAQTQRNTENLKIIGGDTAAEDISKLRKVTLAIGIGKGDHEGTHYLWVAAHKNDTKHVGCEIAHEEAKGIFFSRERTQLLVREGDDDEEAD